MSGAAPLVHRELLPERGILEAVLFRVWVLLAQLQAVHAEQRRACAGSLSSTTRSGTPDVSRKRWPLDERPKMSHRSRRRAMRCNRLPGDQ